MKTLIFLLLLLMARPVAAQQAEPLLFNEKIHDFGNIREDGGNADYEFNFVNNSGRTVKIISVQTSCGCTTPGWTVEPVPPGMNGFIKASFDPKGRPGYFNKTLTISTDLDRNPIVLQIKGQVSNEEMESDNSRLTATSGSLSSRSSTINFGKVYINRAPAVQEFVVYNGGSKAVVITSVLAPDHLKVEAPDSIKANARAVIKIAFNAMLKNQYGFVSDKIELITDDVAVPTKSFPVYATVEEFFLPVAPEEKDKIPVMTLETKNLDFGSVPSGATITREVKIGNNGKKELTIRYVQVNCSCLGTVISKMKVKPGEEEKITVTWKGEGKKGAQHKAITIYSTDPINPVQRIAVTASLN